MRGEISLVEAAVPADDRKVMGKIRTAGIEKPLKVKPFVAGLEALVEVHYPAAAVKEGQKPIGGPKGNGPNAILILRAYPFHLSAPLSCAMQSLIIKQRPFMDSLLKPALWRAYQ
jgi:hypothetical protein